MEELRGYISLTGTGEAFGFCKRKSADVWQAVLGGLQAELEYILGHQVTPYWKAYLLGIPTLFIYTLVWMARIAEELKGKAAEMGIEGPHTSWWHMFGWNIFGILLFGPAVATHRFFRTLNSIEKELNQRNRAE